jgi:SOS-response transcriptional repressor LexA
MHRLTELQAKILSALEKQVRDGDVNFKNLAVRFGVTDTTIREHLHATARKGYLEIKSRGLGRNPHIRLLTAGVPVIGQIAAGPLSEALEFPEGYLKLPSHPGRFGLRVHGDSMADAIQEGDVVLLKKRPHKSGEICAVRIDRSDATLKYLDLCVDPAETCACGRTTRLPVVEVEAKRVVVDGVFSGLLRGDVIDELMQGESEMN